MDSTPKVTQWIIDDNGRVLDAVVEQDGWTIKLITERVCLSCLTSLDGSQLTSVTVNHETKRILVSRFDLATKASECDYINDVDGHAK